MIWRHNAQILPDIRGVRRRLRGSFRMNRRGFDPLEGLEISAHTEGVPLEDTLDERKDLRIGFGQLDLAQRWHEEVSKAATREFALARRSLELASELDSDRVAVAFQDIKVQITPQRDLPHKLKRTMRMAAKGSKGEQRRPLLTNQSFLGYTTFSNTSAYHEQAGPVSSGSEAPADPDAARTVLSGVTGMVASGQFLAILGASGAGKSTLLNCLAGRLPVNSSTSGSVSFNGKALGQRELEALSAYVMQDDHLHPHLTVTETLLFVSRLRRPLHHDHIQRVRAPLKPRVVLPQYARRLHAKRTHPL